MNLNKEKELQRIYDQIEKIQESIFSFTEKEKDSFLGQECDLDLTQAEHFQSASLDRLEAICEHFDFILDSIGDLRHREHETPTPTP